MSQNPFGEGGFDLGSLMEQAQQMQQQLAHAQEQLAAQTFEGSTAGVTVFLTGAGELTGVTFAPEALAGADAEDLGDLVVAAYRDAKSKSDVATQELLGPMAQGLGGFGA